MKKLEKKIGKLNSYQLRAVTGGVVPIVLGGCTFDQTSTSRAICELGLTTVEQ
jgi:hypothetical protein